MRTKVESGREERIASEELDAIRARLARPGDAAGGASTVTDLAEALGVPPETVLAELDRLREERALAPKPGPRRQTALLVLAFFLFVAAYGIHRLTPTPPRPLTDAEVEAESQRVRAEFWARRAHPRFIRYPIETRVRTGPLPPAMFPIVMIGARTTTTLRGSTDLPTGRAATERALALALAHGFAEAKRAEEAAPVPTRPIPPRKDQRWGYDPQPGDLGYTMGSMSGYLRMKGDVPSGHAGAANAETFAWAAKGAVESAIKSQDESLKIQPVSETYISLPPGYGFSIEGRRRRISVGRRSAFCRSTRGGSKRSFGTRSGARCGRISRGDGSGRRRANRISRWSRSGVRSVRS